MSIGNLTNMAWAAPKLPGADVRGQILRTPRAGGQYQVALNVTAKAFGSVVFQPDSRMIFNQESGTFVQRHMCLLEWPPGLVDPMPVHPNDILFLFFSHPVESVVQPTPTPTAQVFTVESGVGRHYVPYHPVKVGNANGMINAVMGDTLTLHDPLPSAITPGTEIIQNGLQYPVDNADNVQGRHIVVYTLNTPHNL